ncbi:MAG: hypothetical protein Q8R00_04950 [Candidatus Nanoarchaeia archaeon]|nr:hypothetical protein [Candidatus Nanoarchaeia archaeon]
MKKNFEEFIKEGIIKKITIDKEKAKFLVKEAEKDYFYLQKSIDKIGVDNETANNHIKLCYDLIMELIRAKLSSVGFSSSGQGAHEAEITYLKVLGFKEADVDFADKIRYFRNGMLYYGTILDKDYAEKVIDFTKRMYNKLKELSSE